MVTAFARYALGCRAVGVVNSCTPLWRQVTAFARYALECRAVGVVKVLESGRLRLTLEGCCMVAGWMHTLLVLFPN